jgi:hypothetical protein
MWVALNIQPSPFIMQVSRLEEEAHLLRVFSKSSVCLLLRNGPGTVIQADLSVPLSPRTFIAAQAVNVTNAVPAKVILGPFEAETCKFLDCFLDADIPQPTWTRVNYLSRKKGV